MLRTASLLANAAIVAGMLCGSVASAEEKPWTLAVIGDQQMPIAHSEWLNRFTSQTDWLAANAIRLNLRMVAQIGDIVEHADELPEWEKAAAAMKTLDLAENADGKIGIPWCVAYGNHEIIGCTRNPKVDLAGPDPSANYRKHFGGSNGKHRYSNQPEFRGVSVNELNTWHIFHSSNESGARRYLLLNLEIDVPGDKQETNFDAIEWAQQVIDAHPGMATVIVTHVFEGTAHGPPKQPYIFGFGHNSQLEIFEKLINDNPQIFLVLSGHVSQDSHQIVKNSAGYPVLQIATDYNKWLGEGGDGFFRLIRINEDAGQLSVQTYSALLDKFKTDANGQFEMELDFKKRFGADRQTAQAASAK